MVKRYRKPYRVKRKRKPIFKNKWFWRVILGLIFAGVSFYFFFLSPIFQIKEINISGKPVFCEKIQKLMNGKNIFLINFDEIKKETLKEFPKIAEVNLKRNFPDKIIGDIEERQPVAVFNQGEEFFFIDREGIIYEKTTPDTPLLKIKKAETGSLLKNNLMSSILDIELKLKDDFKISIEEVLVVSEDRLNIKTIEGWQAYFNPLKDLNWQLTKLKAVLESEIPQAKRKNLEYIDLRFGNLAPYKYRD